MKILFLKTINANFVVFIFYYILMFCMSVLYMLLIKTINIFIVIKHLKTIICFFLFIYFRL